MRNEWINMLWTLMYQAGSLAVSQFTPGMISSFADEDTEAQRGAVMVHSIKGLCPSGLTTNPGLLPQSASMKCLHVLLKSSRVQSVSSWVSWVHLLCR